MGLSHNLLVVYTIYHNADYILFAIFAFVNHFNLVMQIVDNYNFTEHFSLYEMCNFKKYGRLNFPDPVATSNLYQLCAFLESLRSALKSPIIVNSGFRTRAINAGVGGVHDSDHCKGLAADIRVNGYTPIQLAKFIRGEFSSEVGQVIIYPTFVHVSINRYKHRSEFLIKKGNRYEIY